VLLTTKPEPVQTLYLGVAVDIGVAPAVDPAELTSMEDGVEVLG